MRILVAIAVCVALTVSNVLAAAGEQAQAGSSANTQPASARGDELHFVSVLTFHGKIVAVDPARRLVTLKGPNGEVLKLETEKEKDLAARKVGERLLVRYFEGARVGREKPGRGAPVHSLKDGMIAAEPGGPSGKQRAVVASVERVDETNQEITLKEPDGSLETIMISNPDYLSHLKVGDQVAITRPQALALSLENEG
jgi:hypothetical protein